MRFFAAAGAWLGLIAVGAGAFGAHALRGQLDATHLQTFETAVRYQMFHGVALLALGLAGSHSTSRGPRAAGFLFLGGTVLFSGSLYALALGAPRWIGAVTPFGGLAYLAGWLVLAIELGRSQRQA